MWPAAMPGPGPVTPGELQRLPLAHSGAVAVPAPPHWCRFSVSYKGYRWLTYIEFRNHMQLVERLDGDKAHQLWLTARQGTRNCSMRGSAETGAMEVVEDLQLVSLPPVVVTSSDVSYPF